jgi:hypothetical protein
MTVAFPVVPRGTVLTPHVVRVGGDLVSVLGGPTQRITRVGTRYAMDVSLPTLDPACAALWLAAPLTADAVGDTLSLTVPQMIDITGTGTPLGTGTAGSNVVTFNSGGGTPPAPGMWFSVSVGGRHYLHLVTALLATGKIAISPLLRVNLSAAPMDFHTPTLEGFCGDTSWSLEWLRFVGLKFTITENA